MTTSSQPPANAAQSPADSHGRPGMWYAVDAAFTSSPSVEALGESHGSSGPMVLVALFGMAKMQGASGAVRTTFKRLAEDAYLSDAEVARRIVRDAVAVGTLEEVEVSERRVHVRLRGWGDWQKRAQGAERAARHRETKRDGQGTASDRALRSVT